MKLEKYWYSTSYRWLTVLLLPFSWLFRFVVAGRYFLFRCKLLPTRYFSVPVIVVGNITVGGTGKTPFVIWLADVLQKKGYRPGMVSRGVGGKKHTVPQWVNKHADPAWVGDEAVLLAQRTNCPMVVAVDRVLAVKELLKKTTCNVIIADDGLQHYRLGRHIEIAIVDAARQFGNRCLLPAGPLREPISRLKRTDFLVMNGEATHAIHHAERMELVGDTVVSVQHPQKILPLSHFHQQLVHAVAGTGHPERFFSFLRASHIKVIEHAVPDHHLFARDDIYFADGLSVLMTEKDAVKCGKLADERHWFLPVTAKVNGNLANKICQQLEALCVC